MLKKVKIALLDIGNVLIEVNWQRAIDKMGFVGTKELLAIHNGQMYDKFERDQITEAEFFEHIKQQLGVSHSIPQLISAWNAILEKEVEGVSAVLKSYSNKIDFYALTNSNRTHIESEVFNFEVFSHIKKVFTSYDLKCRKPEPFIYQKVITALECKPSDILFVDDKIENVEAARGAGMHAEQCENSSAQLSKIIKSYIG